MSQERLILNTKHPDLKKKTWIQKKTGLGDMAE